MAIWRRFKSFSVYLHEPGQFWPRKRMTGLTKFSVPPNRRLELTFTVTQAAKLDIGGVH